MANFNLYRVSANWYMRIVRPNDSLVFDFTANALSAGLSYGDSYQVQVFSDHIGGHPINLPVLPKGRYELLFYDAAAPAVGDEVLYGRYWNIL